ncbi:MAG: alpha-L-rhamnosidase [Oscillospiraceae bacterium]|nr:alpha-L-rhamnosidase [Oscillospiraceae bacterium]
MRNQPYWIWYPGDFEYYQAMLQNFSRVERGCEWPAFWKSEGFRNRVVFRRSYQLAGETHFTVTAIRGAKGFVLVDDEKHPFGKDILCPTGQHRVSIHAACIGAVPSVYVAGETVYSDSGWTVEDYASAPVNAACSRYFRDVSRDPAEWPLTETVYIPVTTEEVNGGVLYVFETELTAALEVTPASRRAVEPNEECPLVFLGESRKEALDTAGCYCFYRVDAGTHRCPRQALRAAFIPDCKVEDYIVRAIHQFTELPVRGSFACQDEEMNRIFSVASHTFLLCCGCFFLDGIKRDKWIWGGDAYQSLFVNRYLTGDAAIEERTLLALSARDPVTTHVNTIVDYSMLWIIGIGVTYESYGNAAFISQLYPRMKSMMALLESQTDENGFVTGRERDWVFIDWADFDRSGPQCAEQMLLAEAYRVMAEFALAEEKAGWRNKRASLLRQIERFYWDDEKSAYIDTFSSRRHVTRHANIFAIVFDIADSRRKEQLAASVLFNDAVPPITTPYFRFFELEALCRLGFLDKVWKEIKAYWGGMLKMGAVTFWEEFDPKKDIDWQYEMYGDPYGKSLCHAWSASPIYLLARYFVGLRPLVPGGERYEVKPQTAFFDTLDCRFPMGNRLLHITLQDGKVLVEEEKGDERNAI